MLLISSLRRQLTDLDSKNVDQSQDLEFEKSLLNAEFESISERMAGARQKLVDLSEQNCRLSAVFDEKTAEIRRKMDATKSNVGHIEVCIER